MKIKIILASKATTTDTQLTNYIKKGMLDFSITFIWIPAELYNKID